MDRMAAELARWVRPFCRAKQMRRHAEWDPKLLALLWHSVAVATVARRGLGPSRHQFKQHKQTQERDVIKDPEEPGLVAHS